MPMTLLHAASPDGTHCIYCGTVGRMDRPCPGSRYVAMKLEAAEQTLKAAGYTYAEGAEAWKPPLGKVRPALRACMAALDVLLGDSDLPDDDRPGVLAMRQGIEALKFHN